MTQLEFENVATEIPAELWESSLQIGRFRNLAAGAVTERRFSYVARCTVAGDGGRCGVYIKVHKNTGNLDENHFRETISADEQRMREWYEIFRHSERFRVVRPLFAIPEHHLTATEESEGESLYDRVNREGSIFHRGGRGPLRKALHSVGEWLRFKNEILSEPSVRYEQESYLEYIDERLKILVADRDGRFSEAQRDRILRYVERCWSRIPEKERLMTISHSDFNPGNVLVDGDQVTVLDFGRRVLDCHLLDVAKLYHQLELWAMKPHYRRAAMVELQGMLLSGFGDPGVEARQMFLLMYMRHTITHLMTTTSGAGIGSPRQLYDLWQVEREKRTLDRLIEA